MSEADRIRWHCRRGMLELDLALAAFMERHFEALDSAELKRLKTLLDWPDHDLFDLVMGRTQIGDAAYKGLIDRLRESCAT
ncbi:MAG TPA: succinate dehydrogenase assembly factor 2, partial [Burkholderiales bacterium]|nr:succinate dehydrogenase assembly factor 2 [Burkholderiales bacterium]